MIGAEALVRWRHPGPRARPAGTVRPGRRGQRADRPDRPVGPARSLPAGARVAGRPGSHPCRSRSTSPRSNSASKGFLDGRPTHAGETGLDPRLLELELTETVLMESAATAAGAARAEGDGATPRGGRFRHRLLEPQLPDAVPDRRAEGGPVLRPGDHLRPARARPSSPPSSAWARACGSASSRRASKRRNSSRSCRRSAARKGQGFHFSRPLEADHFAALLERRPGHGGGDDADGYSGAD